MVRFQSVRVRPSPARHRRYRFALVRAALFACAAAIALPAPLAAQTASTWWQQNGGRIHLADDPNRPVVLLLHGIGGAGSGFFKPSDDKSGINGFYYDHRARPAEIHRRAGNPGIGVLRIAPSPRSATKTDANNFFDYLIKQRFTVATWTQPGTMFADAYRSAVTALDILVRDTKGPIALVGHSRGGLIVRKLLKDGGDRGGRIRWAIMLHSPNQGSELPRVGVELTSGIARAIDALPLPASMKSTLHNSLGGDAARFTAAYVISPAEQEMIPGSPLLRDLATNEKPLPGVRYYTFGGTSPVMVRYFAWTYTASSAKPHITCSSPTDCTTHYEHDIRPIEIPLLSPFLGGQPRIVPEITPGLGDGLVADARARLPFARHFTRALNHPEGVLDPGIHRDVTLILNGQEPRP